MDSKLYGLAAFGVLLVLFGTVASGQLAVPHQFYGEVTVSGNPAMDGLMVVARIDGEDVAATTTDDGSYGRSPDIFYIPDPYGNRQGDTIEFFVYGIKAGEDVFSNGGSTQLDLAITADICGDGYCTAGESCSSCSKDCGKCGGDGGGSSSGSGSSGGSYVAPPETPNETAEVISVCVEDWVCTDWLDCINDQQKRVCVDSNRCGTTVDKPAETQACVSDIACEPEWTCTEWSSCQLDMTQTRTCTDVRACGTEENKPEETQSCLTGGGITGFFLQPAGIVAISTMLIVILVALLYWNARR